MTLSSVTHLGPYDLLPAIGAGGMAEVYRAKDTRLERTIAVKVLPQHLVIRGGAAGVRAQGEERSGEQPVEEEEEA